MAQATPICPTSCFEIPLSLCKELGNLIAKFWWENQIDIRKIHLVSWKRMCFLKEVGCMRFRDLYTFNLAVLETRLECYQVASKPQEWVNWFS